MKNKKENGFALILSLVLLMVMSLMGGSLVVISSGDHRGNNFGDSYQQAFYVAETGLLEGEKYLTSSFMGLEKREIDPATGNESSSLDLTKKGKPPTNENTVVETDCYKSFKNIVNLSKVVVHHRNASFFKIIEPIFDNTARAGSTTDVVREKDYMQKFTYEYFMVNLGQANFNESGSSIAKASLDIINAGTAYRIYSCGIFDDDEVIIPLESIVVLPG